MYLAEKAGRLADPKTRATITRWCFAALTTIEPVVAMIVLTDFEKKSDDVTKERRATLVKWADRGLAGLETCLGEHAYVTGAEFTVADILMTTVLRQARRAGLLANYPRCEAYRQKCEARPRGLAPSPPTRRASVQNPAPSRGRRSGHSSAPSLSAVDSALRSDASPSLASSRRVELVSTSE